MLPRAIAFAPADIRLVVRVVPNAANRALQFVLDGPMWRSSEEMLEGADAPELRTYFFRGIGPGRYAVGVALQRSGGTKPLIVSEMLCVRGMGSEDTCGLGDGGR